MLVSPPEAAANAITKATRPTAAWDVFPLVENQNSSIGNADCYHTFHALCGASVECKPVNNGKNK